MNLKFRIYPILFLLALSTLTFEVVLSRIFSYLLTYHFVYMIIAFALLAYALGQLYVSRSAVQKKFSFPKYFIILQLSFPLSLAIVFFLPSLGAVGTGSTGLIIYSFLSGITFFLMGVICGQIIQTNGEKSNILYALDLIGAASGALLGLFLLNNFNLFTGLAIILFIITVSSLFVLPQQGKLKITQMSVSAVVLVASLFFVIATPNIKINIALSPEKDLLRLKSNPSMSDTTIQSQWNAFGRTDLVKFMYPDSTTSMSLFIDGAAGTEVVSISALEKDPTKLLNTLMNSNLYFPFNFLKNNEKDSALIIGPGGGIDIAIAYFGNVKFIDAVEVNPTFVELMRKYNPSTFVEKQNINVFIQEGRNFVRNTHNKYDLIFLTIPITKGVRSSDFINLTENYLFTEEALEDYLGILTPEGRIVLTLHNREEVYKVLSNYLELQSKKGISNSEAFKYLYVADQGMMPLLVIKKEPFSIKEIKTRHFTSHKRNFDKGISFFPFVQQIQIDTLIQGIDYQWTMFDNVLEDVSNNKYNFHELTDNASINLHPVFDDSPFFFNYELGIPGNLTQLLWIGVLLLFWTLYMFRKNWGLSLTISEHSDSIIKYFKILTLITFLLGLSYIFIESYLFQTLNLLLNNPVKSFSVLLFSFLLGTGLGSYLTKFIKGNRLKFVVLSIILVFIIVLFETVMIKQLFSTDIADVLLFVIVFIPAIFIGIPFPLLLLEVNESNTKNGISILLGISGLAGFLGGIITLVTATLWGYKYVLIIGLITYGFVILKIIMNLEFVKNVLQFKQSNSD